MRIFSDKVNVPHAYQFNENENPLAFDPIEFAISQDGSKWLSYYDDVNLTGVYLYDWDVQIATPSDNYTKYGIQDGQTLTSTSYDQRDMKLSFVAYGMDHNDSELAFDELQRFLFSREPFWICFNCFPIRKYYVKAKSCSPTYTGDRYATIDVTLTDIKGLSCTVLGSYWLVRDDTLPIGDNLPDPLPQYDWNTSNFTVKNLGDVAIDPERRGQPMTLTLKGYTTGDMTIRNNTNGDSITRHGSWSGTWSLCDVVPWLNGSLDGINTDHGMIVLQKGDNEISISNFHGSVTLDFPFWYLA